MRRYYIFYGILFLLIGILTLNFNYIEGDDAATIMHHALNGNASLQPPYSEYHSMYDKLLSFIPTNQESILRTIGILLSFIFGFLSICLYAKVISVKIADSRVKFFLLLLPFTIPEILFSSLLINPTNLAICFILCGHLFFIKYLDTKKRRLLFFAIALFGLGTSFRWATGFYIFIFFAEYIIAHKDEIKSLFKMKKIVEVVSIFLSFAISIVLFIYTSGYSFLEIIDVYKSGVGYAEKVEISNLVRIVWGIPLFTPAFVILLLLGFIHLIKKRNYIPIIYLFIAFIPYAVTIGFNTSYKQIITLIIPLLLIAVYGYLFLGKKGKYILLGFIFLPWLFGIQMNLNSSWGPGFEIQNKEIGNVDYNNFNPDNNLVLDKYKPVLGSGISLPTLEGPRPLYGFGKVFLSDWSRFVDIFNEERTNAVLLAEKENIDILQDVNHSFISSKLIENGYRTEQSFSHRKSNMIDREFIKENDTIRINVLENKKLLFDINEMNSFFSKKKNNIVIFSSYSNIISKLKTLYPERFMVKGAYWGKLMKE